MVVVRAGHWRQWTMPTHLTRIDDRGSVQTRSFRTVYNVLSDRALRRPIVINSDDARIGTIDSTMQFDVFGEPIRNTLDKLVFDHWVRPGISRVGSNPHLAQAMLTQQLFMVSMMMCFVQRIQLFQMHRVQQTA